MSESSVDLLVFGPHPDDLEIGMAGTIAQHVAAGHRVGLCDLTRGEMGSNGTPDQRVAEAEAARAVLGATVRLNLGLPDGWLRPDDEAQVRAVVRCIRRLRPRTIAAPYWRDRHPDHGAASRLITHAAFKSGLRRFTTAEDDERDWGARTGGDAVGDAGGAGGAPAGDAGRADGNTPVATLVGGGAGADADDAGNARGVEPWRPEWICYYFINTDATPSFAVDVTAHYARKREALACHRSQFAPAGSTATATRLTSPLFVQLVESRDARFGAQIGVPFAEGFIVRELLQRPTLLKSWAAPTPISS